MTEMLDKRLAIAVRVICLPGLLAMTGACAGDHNEIGLNQCSGMFTFEQISDPALRVDARRIIVEFAALDRHVSADARSNGPDGPLIIHGTRTWCRTFGESFLRSEMPEFRGLRYQEQSG